MFCSKNSINFENMYLLSCWFHCADIFYVKFRFCETPAVINSVTRILLVETPYKFRTIRCWFTLYLCMCILSQYKFKCLVHPASLSCVSHSIDICTVAIKNRNMHAASTSQIANILNFNDYMLTERLIRKWNAVWTVDSQNELMALLIRCLSRFS